eukprot:scaffold1750_cov189-Alexandrium_tamarense.AAC.9
MSNITSPSMPTSTPISNPTTATDDMSIYKEQLATANDTIKAYQTQLLQSTTAFQTQLAAASEAVTKAEAAAKLATETANNKALLARSADTQFEIYVSKDTFKFNASHFVAFPGFRERLHGHSYRASVKLLGSHEIGRDGYVLDFGCVKSVAKKVCKGMNEYFMVPMLSEVLKITVEDDEDADEEGKNVCGECGGVTTKQTIANDDGTIKRSYPGSVTIQCEDGSVFVFPRQDCLLLPIMHSTAEELAIYLYGRLLKGLSKDYLLKRGVTTMEVTVSEAVGQDAVFRKQIPSGEDDFDVSSYISKDPIPPMPCATDTEAATKQRKSKT